MTETRAEKAQRLVDEGRVTLSYHSAGVAQASVRGDSFTYETTIRSSGWFFCTCPWGRTHGAGHNRCSHALAVKLAVERTDP